MIRNLQLHAMTGMIILPVMLMTFWLLWPYRPIVEASAPVAITPVVHRGTNLEIRRSFCLSVDTPSTSARHLISHSSGARISLPTTHHYTPPGCHTKTYLVEVPEWAPPGVYTYEVTLTYEVNPLRTVSAHLLPAIFEVID